MAKGFTYRGKHSNAMKVTWTPDATARGSFFSNISILDLERSWSAGGEYFHTRTASRPFEIDCQYEQITQAEREQILRWLDYREGGELIFDDRPWASQHVIPTKKIEFKDYLQSEMGAEFYSGTFTITFTAQDPFAKLIWSAISDQPQADRAKIETGLLNADYSSVTLTGAATEAVIYNPGTEIGHSIIQFSGKTGSDDLVIYNSTTGDKCVLKAGLTTAEGEYWELDSKTGRVMKVSGGTKTIDFVFHDEGQITFKPHMPLIRDINIRIGQGTREIQSVDGLFTEDMEGQWVYLNGWRHISEVTSSTYAKLNAPLPVSGRTTTHIATANQITITKAPDAEITMLKIECKAEVR